MNNKRLIKYKELLINKVYNWLTCTDVIYSNNQYIAVCQCKCGNIKQLPACRFAKSKCPKSCGCYRTSTEFANSQRQYLLDRPELIEYGKQQIKKQITEHPEEVKLRNKKVSDWSKNNPDKIIEKETKHKQWFKDNRDKFEEQCENQRQYYIKNPEKRIEISNRRKQFRCACDISKLANIIHQDDYYKLLNNDIKTYDTIMTECPICKKYAKHKVRSVFIFSTGEYRNGLPPLCQDCHKMYSNYEKEIINFIKSFSNAEIINNDRTVLNGKELDIYIPDKKIAIEFNGDYWHNEEHKDKDYHLNKYKLCKDKDILLVSIFESEWNKNKDSIKEYIKDTLNHTSNKLSYTKDDLMNNNYPDINNHTLSNNILESYYLYNNKKIYTCGYTKLERIV